MELKEKLLSSFMAFEEKIDVHSELHDVRTNAIKNFENKGFPTKKEEAWKYTSLNAILKNDFSVFPKQENAIEFNDGVLLLDLKETELMLSPMEGSK